MDRIENERLRGGTPTARSFLKPHNTELKRHIQANGQTQTNTQQGDSISLPLFLQNKKSRVKSSQGLISKNVSWMEVAEGKAI
jgi:hypothetical protein